MERVFEASPNSSKSNPYFLPPGGGTLKKIYASGFPFKAIRGGAEGQNVLAIRVPSVG